LISTVLFFLLLISLKITESRRKRGILYTVNHPYLFECPVGHREEEEEDGAKAGPLNGRVDMDQHFPENTQELTYRQPV